MKKPDLLTVFCHTETETIRTELPSNRLYGPYSSGVEGVRIIVFHDPATKKWYAAHSVCGAIVAQSDKLLSAVSKGGFAIQSMKDEGAFTALCIEATKFQQSAKTVTNSQFMEALPSLSFDKQ